MDVSRRKPVKYLEGRRLYLRPPEMADEATLRRWYSDELTRMNLELYGPITEASERRYIENNASDDRHASFMVVLNKGDRPIGNVSYRNVRWKDRTAEFAIAIAESAERGRGYGAEASLLILRFLFQTMNLNRVQLGVWDFNETAIRLYERIGFVREGSQRQHGFVNGRYVDHHIYGMLADEYRAMYVKPAARAAIRRKGRGE